MIDHLFAELLQSIIIIFQVQQVYRIACIILNNRHEEIDKYVENKEKPNKYYKQ